MRLTSRVEVLEARTAGNGPIVITRDDEHYQLCNSDKVLTRDEVESLDGVLIIRVIKASAVKP